jgi:acetyl/propionyl-CoA carboxylase alpha subunit
LPAALSAHAKKPDLASVASHPQIEANALHVAQADEAVLIEAAKPVASYLDSDAIVGAALSTGADAIHPGYGFLSENADFAGAVEQAGLIFIGPRPESIAAMGDKARAREIAERAGMPIPSSALDHFNCRFDRSADRRHCNSACFGQCPPPKAVILRVTF